MILTTMNVVDILLYSLLFCISFLGVSLLCIFRKKPKMSKVQHPPSPPALPIVGHLHLLRPALPKTFQALATRYGPLIRLRMASRSAIIVSNATIAKEMLKINELSFVSRPEFENANYNIYDGYTFIFAEYGLYWRFMKKLCMTEVLSVPQVNRFVDIRKQETMKLLKALAIRSNERKACQIGIELVSLTNSLICRMVMSTRCSRSADESKLIYQFVKEIEELVIKFSLGEVLGPLGKLDLFGYGKRLKTLLMNFDALVEKIMVEHENDLDSGKKKRKDIMDILLEISRDEKAELKLSRMHIKSFILVLSLSLLFLNNLL